jgi:hypothetical protein
MSHLRLTTSEDPAALTADPAAAAATADHPSPGAMRFAGFAPMNDQPGFADRKASFVIAAAGLLLSTTLFLVMPLGQFVRPGGFWATATLALALALAVVTLAAIVVAYRCCMLTAAGRPDNPLFVPNVAARPAAAYAEAVEGKTPRSALHDVLDYNHTMARLGAAKYRLAGLALLCLRVAIPLWVLLLVLVTARGA